MKNLNPYAPPKSAVSDVNPDQSVPMIWNPNAAANWSILFSPVFGATLQMMNWKTLGEPQRANSSKKWAIFTIAFYVFFALSAFVIPEDTVIDKLSRPSGLAILLIWYFFSAKKQQRYVKEKFGTSYLRKEWGKPLLLALASFFGFIVVMILIGSVLEAATL